jgi:FkbM family methyltransferase
VQCHNVAVGAGNGPVELYDYALEDASSHASLYREVIERIHRRPSVVHRVRMIRLDDYLENQFIDHVDLLKIDTEGHELSVLTGSKRFIEEGRIEAIQFEFNEMNSSSRTFFKDFFELLPHYDFYRLLPRGMIRIEEYNPLYCEIYAYQNIVAILRKAC